MGLRPSLEDALFGCAAFEAIRFVPLEDDGVPEYDDGSVYRGDPHVAIMQETLAEVRAATAAFVERHQAALSPEVLALLRDNAAASRGGALCGGVLSVDAHPDLVRACDALGWRAHLERFVEQFDLYRMPREHHAAASALVDSLCAALKAEAPSAPIADAPLYVSDYTLFGYLCVLSRVHSDRCRCDARPRRPASSRLAWPPCSANGRCLHMIEIF